MMRQCWKILATILLILQVSNTIRYMYPHLSSEASYWCFDYDFIPTTLFQIRSAMEEEGDHQEEPVMVTTTTVAYVISVTSCKPKFRNTLRDASLVLKRSIEQNSFPKHPTSRYSSKFYAVMTTDIANGPCGNVISQSGYELYTVDRYPVLPEEIEQPEGSMLKNGIARDGCCGHTELLKLHVYQMTNHTLAVHLDLDTLVINPFDELFDVMLTEPGTERGMKARQRLIDDGSIAPTYQPVDDGTSSSSRSSLLQAMTYTNFYTKDYNMIQPGKEHRVGIQGGLLVVRTNTTTYEELVSMVKSGQFYPGRDARTSGWFQSGYGMHIWGVMTIQGLLAYYYDLVAHETSVELNRCVYNQIVDNPRRSTFDKRGKYPRGTPLSTATVTYHDTTCRDGRSDCDDVQCQNWPLERTKLLHYTYCKVPWACGVSCTYNETLRDDTCRLLHLEWFKVRRSFEKKTGVNGEEEEERIMNDWEEEGNVEVTSSGKKCPRVTLGFCNEPGGYVPIPTLS